MSEALISDDYVFSFGKHKGKQIVDVESSYILWCEKNIDWFNIDPEYRELVERDYGDEEAEKLQAQLEHEALMEQHHGDWGDRDQ